jgi:hypothetical protein
MENFHSTHRREHLIEARIAAQNVADHLEQDASRKKIGRPEP